MKKLLSLLGVVTITGTSVTALTSTNFISTQIKIAKDFVLKNSKQLKIDWNNFKLLFNTERWGNNFIIRLSHNAISQLREHRQNAIAALGILASGLGIATYFTADQIQQALGVSAGVASVIAIFIGLLRDNPEALTNAIENNIDEENGNGLDLNVRNVATSTAGLAFTVTRPNSW